jgi:hypothetical protein
MNPHVAVLPESPEAIDPNLPPHLVAALHPGRAEREGRQLGPHLVGQTFCCLDQKTGSIAKFTIKDCGTSHLRGEWSEMEGEDLRVLQITPEVLEEKLANRVE